jgi:predicted acyl esterase
MSQRPTFPVWRLRLLVFVAAFTVADGEARAEDTVDLGNVVEKHEMAPMRDGKRLSTYLYFPPGPGPWPVLYEQRYADLRGAASRKAFARVAAAGFVVAVQNFRGTHLSEGTWVGYRALGWGEQKDGYDTVEWLAKQPWSTGKIGTVGGSQAGFAQNFLAVTRPPHLVVQYMTDTGLSLFHEGYRIGGATRPERFKQMDAVCRDPGDNRRLMAEWFAHPRYDDYWRQEDCTLHLDKMDVPCFTLGSWFDFMCVGSVESFIGRQHRGGPNSRGRQQLLIGPWAHGGPKDNHVGELTYPANAAFEREKHLIRWFDHYLKGVNNGVEKEPSVRYYVMGATGEPGAPGNEWRSAANWPVPARDTPYYFHASGRLSESAPIGEHSTTEFRADPLHPSEIPGRAFPGATDARLFEKQAEVRTFTTEILADPVEWTGKVRAELFVTSTAKDTDFIVRVSDVYPDGRSILLMDYIRRARYRDGYDKEVLMEPGKVYKVAFDVGWVSQIFNKGHRIRVTTASTGAPFYEPNPNTGEPLTIEFSKNAVVATNSVFHERQYASRIIAPVHAPDQRGRLDRGRKELDERLAKLKTNSDTFSDAAVFAKGLSWALQHDETFVAPDFAVMERALERGRERVTALEAGRFPWANRKGKLVRGYVSAVDGSVQPFGLIIPHRYDPAKPTRLDVVLHGSTKPVGLSELRFMSRFDDGDEPAKSAPDVNYIELHPLGRVENCYRWAGETDVFEAIEAVRRNYAVDRDRIVLRGMSMGASGTWHLGLKYPDRFIALGPYCGYVDTHEFSKTPLANFVRVGELPAHQEKALHMLDSVDYAANAGVVPAIACMGEKDVFFQAHVLMGHAMEREGLKMVNLISPGTGHVIDPVTHAQQMRRIGEYATKGIDHAPKHLRFVTWTLKYSRCHWLEVLGLEEHYARAELDATMKDDGSVEVTEPKNITRFAILPPALRGSGAKLRVDGREVLLPAQVGPKSVIGKRDGRWEFVGQLESVAFDGKRPGLQGPIDDAFTTPFLCVRGTGTPWNPAIQDWTNARLMQFAREWDCYFRGDLRIKNDVDVTDEDMRRCNLILFGDPGSNRLIAKVLPKLPISWSKNTIEFGGARYTAADHVPVMIQPNPLAAGRYVVINTGHTFGENELSSLNYLLFPRFGDWAMITLPSGEPACAGFFDERWRLPATQSQRD